MPRYLDYQILNQDKIIGEGHISNIKRRLTNRRWRQYIPQKYVDIQLKLAKPEAIYGVQFRGYDIHQVQISFKDQNKKEITKMKYLLNFSDELIDCVLEATEMIYYIDVKLSNSDQNMKRMGFNFFFVKGDPKIKDDEQEVDQDGMTIKKKKGGRKNRHNMQVFVLADSTKKVDYFISKNKIQKMVFDVDEAANPQKIQKIQVITPKVQQKIQPQEKASTKIQPSEVKQKNQAQQKQKVKPKANRKKPTKKNKQEQKKQIQEEEKQQKKPQQNIQQQKKVQQEKNEQKNQEKNQQKKSKKTKSKPASKKKKQPILQSFSDTEQQKEEDAFQPKQKKTKKIPSSQPKKKKSSKKKVQTQEDQNFE